MADENKVVLEGEYANDKSIAQLWKRIKQTFVRQDGDKVLSDNNFSDADKAKLDGIEAGANLYVLPKASGNELGGVKIGEGLEIDENGVVRTVYNPEMPVDWEDIQHTPTTLEGYGITDAASDDDLQAFQDQVDEALGELDDKIEEVREEVTKVYKYCGTVETKADLDEIAEKNNGDIYDVTEDGHNYAWNEAEERWDDLGGTFRIKPLTEHDIDVITGYASSPEIFDELIEEGGEIELADDMEISGQKTITKDVVIELNGYDLTSDLAKSAKKELFIVDGAKLTIKGEGSISANYRIANAVNGGVIEIDGGDLDAGNVGLTATGENSTIIFNDGYLTAVEGGAGAFDGAEIYVNGGTMEISDNFALFTNGSNGRGGNTIVMNGGTMIGKITSNGYEACGVYIANDDTFIMNGGEILGTNGAGLCMRAGHVVINDGMIMSTGEAGTTGKIGDGNFQMGKSAVIYHEKANYPGKAGMQLEIKGGTFVGVDHSLEILSNEATPNVIVTGGAFTPDYPEA